jgi:hypothetical protein
MSIKITIPNTSSDTLTFGSANTPTAAQIAGIDSGSSNGQLALYTTASGTSTERVRVDASGNVGIGTSSPTSRLTIGTGSYSAAASGTTGMYTTATGLEMLSDSYFFGSRTGSTRAIIDSSGNLLVGTNSNYAISGTNLICASTANCITANTTAAAGSGWFLFGGYSDAANVNTAGTLRFRVTDNGNVANSNGVYGAISDAKLKENVVDATPKLDKLNQVRVVNYNLIGDTQKQIGVIAQELEQIFPSMIEETPDRDKDGNDLGTTTKAVKYSVFVPMLIKAIQEQQALITKLQADVAALKAQP